jgi:hypothetical protein
VDSNGMISDGPVPRSSSNDRSSAGAIAASDGRIWLRCQVLNDLGRMSMGLNCHHQDGDRVISTRCEVPPLTVLWPRMYGESVQGQVDRPPHGRTGYGRRRGSTEKVLSSARASPTHGIDICCAPPRRRRHVLGTGSSGRQTGHPVEPTCAPHCRRSCRHSAGFTFVWRTPSGSRTNSSGIPARATPAPPAASAG